MSALGTYNFFEKHRLLLLVLVLLAFGSTFYFSSKIKLVEDINKFIPKDKKIDEVNFVLENLKVKDKLIIKICNTDSTVAETSDLMLCADALADSLNSERNKWYVRDITCKISDDIILPIYSSFYNNLPLFLEENDYKSIDNFIKPDTLKEILKGDYRTLLTPSSFIFSRFIKKDPINITPLVLKKLQSLKFDDNFDANDGYIMTRDKKNLMVYITPSIAVNNNTKTKLFIESLNGIIKSLQDKFNNRISIEYYGAAAVSLGNATQIEADAILTSSIAFFFIILILGLFFKRFIVIFYILLPVIFGALFSLTILYFIKEEISAIAIGSGSIILGIAINYSLHFFTHFKHERSIEKVITDLSFPMIVGCTTTVGAFLSLQFAKSQAINDFGLFAGFSLIGAVLFSIIVLPHLLKHRKGEANEKPAIPKTTLFTKIISYRIDKNKPVVIATLILTCVFAYTATKVTFESDLIKMNYQNETLQKAQQHLDKINNFSRSSVYVVSKGKNLNEALKVNELAYKKLNQLKDENVISKFSSVSTLLISDSLQQFRINRWNAFWTKEKKDSLQKRLIRFSSIYKFKEDAFSQFYSKLQTQFKPVELSKLDTLKKLVVNDWVTENKNVTTILSLVSVEPDKKTAVYNAFENNKSIVVFDTQYMLTQFVNIITSDFNLILIITGLLVFGFMLLSHGRIELVIINFLPMFIGWIWILGIMGIFGLKFNIINIILSTFIFGLGDDYGIFIMDGLAQEYKYGRKNLNSYKTSIFLSALTTVIGIGVLIFAKHPALRSIAIIAIIGMTTVLFISFIVQPLLYDFLILNRKKKKLLPYTWKNLLFSFALHQEQHTVNYFKPQLIKNYIYKGPILEWQCRAKMRKEGNFKLIESYLPKQGKIVDIGCGYGFLTLMLSFMGENRKILGIDNNEEKINVADNCISKSEKVNFVCSNPFEFDYEFSDAFIISMQLDFLSEQHLIQLISKCLLKLNKNGVIVIRDIVSKKNKQNLTLTSLEKILEKFPSCECKTFNDIQSSSTTIFLIQHKNSTL